MPALRKNILAGSMSLLLATTVAIEPTPANAGTYGFATEWTQLANHAELSGQLLKMAKQLATQLAQYQLQKVQGQLLPHQVWGTVASDLIQLANVVKGGHSLAYSMAGLDAQFTAAYPGYKQPSVPYYQQYANWNQTSFDTLAGALRALNVQSSELGNEQGLLTILHHFAGSAVGQDQAIQVGTLIADQQVQQLEKLRELMLVNIQAQAAVQGRNLQADAAKTQTQASAFDKTTFYPTN